MIRRKIKDHVFDTNSKKLLSLSKSTSHIFINGRLLQDIEDNYTFCTQYGRSVTDYLLLNNRLSVTEHIWFIYRLQNFEILNWIHFPDHAALRFSLKRKCIKTSKFNQPEHIIYKTKFTFDEQKTEEFKDNL